MIPKYNLMSRNDENRHIMRMFIGCHIMKKQTNATFHNLLKNDVGTELNACWCMH